MPPTTRREFFTWSVLGAAGLAVSRGRAAEPVAPVTGEVRLPDGRRLAFNEYGNPSGSKVVIHHHSLPGSRREAEVFLPALAAMSDVRLISFDRPGFGDSDPVAVKSFDGWTPDLVAAADALGVSRFAVTAFSGGTPYALAAAITLPERITRIGLGCSAGEHLLGRFNGTAAPVHRLSRMAPRVAGVLVTSFRRQVERSPKNLLNLVAPLAPKERELFADPAAVEFAATVLLNGLKQGPDACVSESALVACAWGLSLCKVKAPTTLWHGTADRFSPPWKSEQLARDIPGAKVCLSKDDGHLSLPNSRAAEILAAVTA